MMKAALLLVMFVAAAAAQSASAIGADRARQIAPGVWLLPGGFERGRQPDGNTVIWSGVPHSPRPGLVVLDTGRHAAHSQAILDFAARQNMPIVAVVNSHWHLDHISGNARLRARHPQLTVYASNAIEGALRGFLARSRRDSLAYLEKEGDSPQSGDVRGDVATIDSGPALFPDVSIFSPQELELAGHRLHLGFEPFTVTAGDVWLYEPESGVLAAGDLVTLPAPFFDTACPARWRTALARLSRVPFKWLVPGHGEPMTPAAFAIYRRAFDELADCASSLASKQACAQKWLETTAALNRHDEDQKLAAALLDYYLDSVLRGSKRGREDLCGGLSPEAG